MQGHFTTLKELSMRIIHDNYGVLSSLLTCVPGSFGQEIVRVQLLRGNMSPDLLTLAWNCKIREVSLVNLACKQLEETQLAQLSKLTESLESFLCRGLEVPTEQLSNLFLGFTNLRVFEYSYSNEFNDEVAEIIIRNNRNLQTFLVGKTKITDTTLNLLASCESLKAVDVSHNLEISNKGLCKLCNGRSRKILEDLRVYMCKINDETVTYILNTCPNLRNVYTFASMKTFETDFEDRSLQNIEYFVPL